MIMKTELNLKPEAREPEFKQGEVLISKSGKIVMVDKSDKNFDTFSGTRLHDAGPHGLTPGYYSTNWSKKGNLPKVCRYCLCRFLKPSENLNVE